MRIKPFFNPPPTLQVVSIDIDPQRTMTNPSNTSRQHLVEHSVTLSPAFCVKAGSGCFVLYKAAKVCGKQPWYAMVLFSPEAHPNWPQQWVYGSTQNTTTSQTMRLKMFLAINHCDLPSKAGCGFCWFSATHRHLAWSHTGKNYNESLKSIARN